MAEGTEHIRELIDRANGRMSADASIGFLIMAIESLCDYCDELETRCSNG